MEYSSKPLSISVKKMEQTPKWNIVRSTLNHSNSVPQLGNNQKLAITKIIQELAAQTTDSAQTERQKWLHILHSPQIQRLIREELGVTDDAAIRELEKEIIRECQEVIKENTSNKQKLQRTERQGSPHKSSRAADQASTTQPSKQQPLTLLQRKELERQLTLDYSQFPAQPCVRSLYYLSKIAQSQSLKIIVPPTILLGFNDDNRIMYNDYQTGLLVVESKNISPKRIQSFIQSHMIDTPGETKQSIEEQLLCPKFLIKLAGKGSIQNDVRIFYSKETMIPELLCLWGSTDLAVQGFVRQRHPMRPSIYRVFVNRNGHVYKAVAVNNQENITKESKIHKILLQLIEDAHNKSKKTPHKRQKSEAMNGSNPQIVGGDTLALGGQRHSISLARFGMHRGSILTTMDQLMKNQGAIGLQSKWRGTVVLNSSRFSQQKQAGESLGQIYHQRTESAGKEVPTYTAKLDQRGFPTSLEHYKLNDYYSSIQQSVPNSDLKKAYTISSDNIDNLSMMNCRPSALQQATQMTTDLYRLFSQYYLKIQKFGNISQFVCDFIEDQNGLMYLLQVKSFECEGIRFDWQVPFNPQPSSSLQQHISLLGGKLAQQGSPIKSASQANMNITCDQLRAIEEQQMMSDLEGMCEAGIICQDNRHQPNLKEWLIQACKDKEMWEFGVKQGHVPQVSHKVVQKYRTELEYGKECFCLQSEKQRISPFFPLTTFCEQTKVLLGQQRMAGKSLGRSVSIKFANPDPQQQASANNSSFHEVGSASPSARQEYTQSSNDETMPACLACFKVIELFTARYYALVFKTEQTVEELRKLKLKLVNHWTLDNVMYLTSMYKEAKKSFYIVGDIEKIEKRVYEQTVRERAKSPESVMRKTIKNNRRPFSAQRQISEGFGGGGGGGDLQMSGGTRINTQNLDKIIAIDENEGETQRHGSPPAISQRQRVKKGVLKSSRSLIRSIDRFQKHLEETGISGLQLRDESQLKTTRQTTLGESQPRRPYTPLQPVQRPLTSVLSSKNRVPGHCLNLTQKRSTEQQPQTSSIDLNPDQQVEMSPYQDTPQGRIQLGFPEDKNPAHCSQSKSTVSNLIFGLPYQVQPPQRTLQHSQSSAFSSRNIPKKNQLFGGGSKGNSRGSVMTMINSSIQKKSDKEMSHYFNNKRLLNRNHPELQNNLLTARMATTTTHALPAQETGS